MKKTLVWGFEWESQIEAIKNIHHKKLIEVMGWVISPSQQSKVINGLNMIDIRHLRLEKQNFSGKAHHLYDDVKATCLEKFIEMYSRNHFTESYDYTDFLQAFNLFYDYFATLLIERNIELILFSYLPHFGDDLILYTLAKKLGVTTVIYYQSHIPNRLYYMLDMDDYGRFETIPLHFNHPYISIEKKHEKEHFYMKKKRLDVPCTPRFLKEMRRVIFRRKNHIGLLNTLKLQSDCIRYKKNLKKHSINHIDFHENFVYFPLHLQPELTTSALGGPYSDQLLAIEILHTLLPKDWKIIVKENPKQLQKYRGPLFFERLSRIKNVILASPEVNTFELIKKCRFVATITGTAGWEAISGGKNVLIFGHAWYRTLPGVFEYHKNFSINSLLQYKIDHNELETRYNELIQKTAPGIVDRAYNVLVKDYTDENNSKILTTTLEKTLIKVFEKDCT